MSEQTFENLFSEADRWPEYFTKTRCKKAFDILEMYRSDLYRGGEPYFDSFESDLRGCWDVGYQTIKSILHGMLHVPRYRFLAINMMDKGCPGVVSEHQEFLAETYGSRYFRASDLDQNRKKFWDFFDKTIRCLTDEDIEKIHPQTIDKKYENLLKTEHTFYAPGLREEYFLFDSKFTNYLGLNSVYSLMMDQAKFRYREEINYVALFYLDQMTDGFCGPLAKAYRPFEKNEEGLTAREAFWKDYFERVGEKR